MAFTNKGNKWELKNSLYLIFSFIPFFNSICFFHMDGKVTNKKWKRAGWITLGLNIFLIVVIFTFALLSGVEIEQVPYDTSPRLEDYLGRNYYDKYSGYSEYSKLPQYEAYLDAMDEWANSNEIKSMIDKNVAFQNTVESIGVGAMLSWFLMNMIVFFYLVSLRPSYLKALAKGTNKDDVINRLGNNNNSQNKKSAINNLNNNNSAVDNSIKNNPVISNNIVKPENQYNPVKTKTDEIKGKIDISIATEKQLIDLPLLTVIDAKRAIDYREEHSGFESVDEFFDVINAKPHIIAKLDSVLIISNPRKDKINSNARTATYKTNRRIDI